MARRTLEAPSRERLKELLEYNPISGQFTWLKDAGFRGKAGDIAGGRDVYGSIRIGIDKQVYPAHYLAWLYVHNEWPTKVKHRNGRKDDNRIENLFVLKKDPVNGYKQNGEISHTRLRELLHYSPDTGSFIWKIATSNRGAVNSVAGFLLNTGYRYITLDGQKYLAHRLAWFYVNGEWPSGDIDHIDRNRDNNAIANLRPATRSQNMSNGGVRKDSKSGYRGVTWHAQNKSWRATIQKDGKQHYLGCYKNVEDAAEAYRVAAIKIFGQFAGS